MVDSNSRMLLSSEEVVRLNSIPMSFVRFEYAGFDFNFVSSFKYFQNLSFVFNSDGERTSNTSDGPTLLLVVDYRFEVFVFLITDFYFTGLPRYSRGFGSI